MMTYDVIPMSATVIKTDITTFKQIVVKSRLPEQLDSECESRSASEEVVNLCSIMIVEYSLYR